MSASKRLAVLDQLRGLASLAVVIHHALLAFPIFYAAYDGTLNSGLRGWTGATLAMRIFAYTPLHLLWGGHEAVILFFVLSGLVLALPYVDGRPPRYKQYLIKRFCRIYLPYAVSVSISAVLLQLLSTHGIAGLSSWFNGMWAQPVTGRTVLNLIFMVRSTHQINTATWSLLPELAVSVIFPALMWAVMRYHWAWSLIAAGLLSSISAVIPGAVIIHYTAMFMIGAVLAKHRAEVTAMLGRWSAGRRYAAAVISVLLLSVTWELGTIPIFNQAYLQDWVIAAGCTLLIMMALAYGDATGSERNRLNWLGRISYSLYLVHTVVLLTLNYGLKGLVPQRVLVAVGPVVSLVVAHFFYRLVEEPSLRLGRRLAEFVQGTDRRSKAA